MTPDGPADSESRSESNLSRFVGSSAELFGGLGRRFPVLGRSSLPQNAGPPWEAVDPFLLLAGPPWEAVDPFLLEGPPWEAVNPCFVPSDSDSILAPMIETLRESPTGLPRGRSVRYGSSQVRSPRSPDSSSTQVHVSLLHPCMDDLCARLPLVVGSLFRSEIAH